MYNNKNSNINNDGILLKFKIRIADFLLLIYLFNYLFIQTTLSLKISLP